MKTKSLNKYLEKRLDRDVMQDIEKQAQFEIKILKSIKLGIANAMAEYMAEHNIGFNELVRRLDASPTHVAKIQKGEANLTLSSLAHLFALLGKEPQDVFKAKK